MFILLLSNIERCRCLGDFLAWIGTFGSVKASWVIIDERVLFLTTLWHPLGSKSGGRGVSSKFIIWNCYHDTWHTTFLVRTRITINVIRIRLSTLTRIRILLLIIVMGYPTTSRHICTISGSTLSLYASICERPRPSLSVFRIRNPGWVKNQDRDLGWTSRIIFPRA